MVITYNRPPGGAVSFPTISPTTEGRWLRSGPTELMFKPAGYWQPATTYRVSVPVPGTKSATAKFTTRLPSTLVLQQYLAMLGYLPLRFTPSGDVPNRKAVLERDADQPKPGAAGGVCWRLHVGLSPGPHLSVGTMASRPAQRRDHGSGDAVRNRRGLGS